MKQTVNIFWFRRDLRLTDNKALYHALSAGLPVLPVFIFDRNILDELEERGDKRVCFIYNLIHEIQQQLAKLGSSLVVAYGHPKIFFANIIKQYSVKTVYANHDYEPYATERDKEIKKLLNLNQISFETFKDQVIFEKDEVVKPGGSFYSVYTPYSKRWLEKFHANPPAIYHSEKLLDRFFKQNLLHIPSLKSMNFKEIETVTVVPEIDKEIISTYDKTRNLPAIKGTSKLGIHLRFGSISIRELVAKTIKLNLVFLKELIWREFFMQILWHKPGVVQQCFKPEYESIAWRNNVNEFERWCAGKTGYPIVDAGMRQLNETGFMHNRMRMITASFLVKHLLIDWRWGEAYFAQKLLDYELASNNGNWQWVAGCGCDAAPYFRIFNPIIQAKKFDPEERYIQQWVREYRSGNYPIFIVDHKLARERCLSIYKKGLSQNKISFI